MSAKPRAPKAPSPAVATNKPARWLKLPSVLERVPFSRPSIYRLMREGKFPKAINMAGGKAVCWLESDIDTWMAERFQASRQSSPSPETDQVA